MARVKRKAAPEAPEKEPTAHSPEAERVAPATTPAEKAAALEAQAGALGRARGGRGPTFEDMTKARELLQEAARVRAAG